MSQDFPQQPGRQRRAWCSLASVSLCLSLAIGMAPTAAADEYDDRTRVRGQITTQRSEVNAAEAAFRQKVSAAATAAQRSQQANSALLTARNSLSSARTDASKKAAALKAANTALAKAKAELSKANADVVNERRQLSAVARSALQQNGGLENLAVLVGSDSTADLADRLEWVDSMSEKTDADLTKLEAAQKRQKKAYDDVTAAQGVATRAKTDADNAVATRSAAEQTAASAAATAASAKSSADQARKDAAKTVAQEREGLRTLQSEEAGIEKRIKARIAREKAAAIARAKAIAAAKAKAAAAAKAKAAAEAKARAAAIAKAKAVAAAKAKAAAEARRRGQIAAAQKAEREAAAAREAARKAAAAKPKAKPAAPSAPVETPSSSGDFGYPVSNPRITSHFGMRFHPVLHVWALHSGADFGATCGTPIYSPADGVIAEKGWSSKGLGNHLVIDHDPTWRGHVVSTGYGHAQGYVVRVGQHVRKGQLVGYVGTTGYSTGCHLHYQVYLDGSLVNPESTIA